MTRVAIAIEGVVQGVGFRPFVYGLATRSGLGGFVRNRAGTVEIEAEGPGHDVDTFLESLRSSPPPLAKIERISCRTLEPGGELTFRIEASELGEESSVRPIFISPDVATCDECLTDLFDPGNRRYLYPFVNCTNCGPRLTIVKGAPYDRQLTTMAAFEMCDQCRAEYVDPGDRRFHAQPTCCPKCGPRLEAVDRQGTPIGQGDPIERVAQALRAGKIAAIKGLGGYHLACDAGSEAAVQTLRRRKHRDEKPFAVMVADVSAARVFCDVNAAEAALLRSIRRPIVLLRKKEFVGDISESIAPRNPWLGVMLPYTPVHHLLLRQLDGAPLVMTSGNRSDEPIAYQDGDALKRLGGIADIFLMHNRSIHVRCDDSVTRIVGGSVLPIRRSRGYAPQPLRISKHCSIPTLAVGGQLKATFALGHQDKAFISHHMGDLDHFEAAQAFERDVSLYENLFNINARLVAHDLHPDYVSTQYARRRAGAVETELLPIQHHHAHMASCMAENELDERVIGVTFDGTGYGTDGTVWGGEFLVGDYRHIDRVGHLRCVGMPGGDAAIKEPWRMALAHVVDAEVHEPGLESRISGVSLCTVRQMIARQFNTPITSSAGRLFDAVASLAGIRDRVSFEGQAAVEMEHLASAAVADCAYPFDIAAGEILVVDTRPMIRSVVEDLKNGASQNSISKRFHSTLVEMIVTVCHQIKIKSGIDTIVLSGGVFLNALLTTETSHRLASEGFRVYRHRRVPPNDGGLSLGQLAIAAAWSNAPQGEAGAAAI
jgi:hydrogenase maturation protein HypF